MSTPVIVNLRVNAAASGEIEVFSADQATVTNEVIATQKLPVTSLYTAGPVTNGVSSDSGIWRFRELEASPNTREAEVVPTYSSFTGALVTTLDACLKGGLETENDATSPVVAEPFDDAKYDAGGAAYRTYDTIGDLALAVAAHEIFGHVQATAAINNDTAFVGHINANNAVDFALGAAATGANIACQLAAAIGSMLEGAALEVVEQVIGQDAARAKNVDNSEVAPGTWQFLEFKEDDLVYVQITLTQPAVSSSASGADQQFTYPGTYTHVYNIRLTLV